MNKGQAPGLTKGTLERTACPWCGQPQNFKDVEDYGVEVGAVLQCEKCQQRFEIKRVQPVTVLWLGRYQGSGPRFGG